MQWVRADITNQTFSLNQVSKIKEQTMVSFLKLYALST